MASIRSASPARSSTPAGSASCASTIVTASTSTAGPATPAFVTSSRPRRSRPCMPTKAPRAPIAVIGPTNWTGFYAGGFFGAAGGRTDIAFPASPQATNRPWVFGPVGGIQLGYNYQFTNNWVLGFEGDIGAADVHGGRSAGAQFTVPGMTSAYFGLQDKTSWMATATARVGYALGRTLFYGKGGAAFENSNVSATCFNPQVGRLMFPISASIRRARCLRTGGFAPQAPASAGPSATAPNSTLAGTGRPRPSTTISRSAGTRRWRPTAPRSWPTGPTSARSKVGLNYRFRPHGGGRQVLMPGSRQHPDRPNLEFNRAAASGGRPISFAAGGKSRSGHLDKACQGV